MENESLKPIYVPDNIVLNIELALHRKGRAKITDKTCLELIAQIVDWWEASLTDKELETALFMLGDRQKLSKPPGKESFSIGMLIPFDIYHRERKTDEFSGGSKTRPTRLASH